LQNIHINKTRAVVADTDWAGRLIRQADWHGRQTDMAGRITNQGITTKRNAVVHEASLHFLIFHFFCFSEQASLTRRWMVPTLWTDPSPGQTF